MWIYASNILSCETQKMAKLFIVISREKLSICLCFYIIHGYDVSETFTVSKSW